MSRGNDAASAIRREIKRIEQLQLAATLLDEFGSLENATAEAEVGRKKATEDMETAKKKLAKMLANIAKAEENEAVAVALAESRGKDLMAEVTKEAKAKIVAANTRSATIVDAAQKQAARSQADAGEVLTGLETKRQELAKQVVEVEAELWAKTKEVKSQESKLERIKKQLAKMMTVEG